MNVTIKDVARLADVSIATVSHVINKTRYVSPLLVERVQEVMRRTGYNDKVAKKEVRYRAGRGSGVAFVVPNVENTVYSRYAAVLSRHFAEHGLLLSVHLTHDDPTREQHILSGLTTDKSVSGIILAPVSDSPDVYARTVKSGIPLICMERRIDDPAIDCVVSENGRAVYQGTDHLIACGHENIALILEERRIVGQDERFKGYRRALDEHGVPFHESLVLRVDLNDMEGAEETIRAAWSGGLPTAFLAGGNRLTLLLARVLDGLGVEVPRDVSVLGYGDGDWCSLTRPPLTVLKMDAEAVCRITAGRMLEKIARKQAGETDSPHSERVPIHLIIRGSTRVIARGPCGEQAHPPEVLNISEAERLRLRRMNLKVGISFHYSGTAWKRLHEMGIRDTLDKLGIKIVAVTEAHFDPHLQLTQLESLRIQRPDAIIAIPADDKITARKFKALSRECKLVFLSTIPEGFTQQDYAGCVTVNERESGRALGTLLGKHFQGREARVGFIRHGASFQGTVLRDNAAEQVIRENYPNLSIVESLPFQDIERAYDTARRMLETHPDICGLYVSWERPALQVIRALKEMGREDVALFTFDLDVEIASYMARGEMVAALSTQRPYEQGVAVAQLTARALLGENRYKYILIQPYVVEPKNLRRAWHDIIHEPLPAEIEESMDFLRK